MDSTSEEAKPCRSEAPPIKRTCIRSSLEPDVTIIVGQEEYKEYGQTLMCWSNYFDRALAGGMIEQKSRKFEFPDKKPKDWEWIVGLMAPGSEQKVTVEKLPIALEWFDFLCSKPGLRMCDNVIVGHLNTLPCFVFDTDGSVAIKKTNKDHVMKILAYLETAVKYNLGKSKEACFKALRFVLVEDVKLFSTDALQRITSLVKEQVECRSHFLGPLKTHLRKFVSEEQAEVLLQNGMLHCIVAMEVDRLKTQAQLNRVAKLVEKTSVGTNSLNRIRHVF